MKLKQTSRAVFALALASASVATAQMIPQKSGTANAINGVNTSSAPGAIKYTAQPSAYGRRINLFLTDWHESLPRIVYGSLVLRNMLTAGDNFNPPERGATLRFSNFLAYGRLPAGETTTPAKTTDDQNVLYITAGEGSITAAGETVQLHKGMLVLVPARLEFSLHATFAHDLTLYIVQEHEFEENGIVGNIGRVGFHVQKKLVVRDETTAHTRTALGSDASMHSGASQHWSESVKELLTPADGLGTLNDIAIVTMKPNTLSEPEARNPDEEEIWVALDGSSSILLGSQLRTLHPGMAYMPPPDGITVRSNINNSAEPVRFLYIGRFPNTVNWVHAVAEVK